MARIDMGWWRVGRHGGKEGGSGERWKERKRRATES